MTAQSQDDAASGLQTAKAAENAQLAPRMFSDFAAPQPGSCSIGEELEQ